MSDSDNNCQVDGYQDLARDTEPTLMSDAYVDGLYAEHMARQDYEAGEQRSYRLGDSSEDEQDDELELDDDPRTDEEREDEDGDVDDEDEEEYDDPCDYEDRDDLIDGVGFARPGANSALRAATASNPRNLPCPTCHEPNRLTPLDRARGYQCDTCADRSEGGLRSFMEY